MRYIHPRTDVLSQNIGEDTTIWQFCVILPDAQIGSNCNICAHVFIENKVVIGNNVTIKSGVQLWDGITIEDNVFIGPNVTFTNELIPRSKAHDTSKFKPTLVKKGASIGANATILPGLVIGEYSFIGAGSIITKDIPDYSFWYGNPAIQKGYITEEGILLDMDKRDKNGVKHILKIDTDD
ncbi:MAG: N-acetyltransferase [Bacteroidales bacterium]|jgi:acetyltransferase-like isoleucine patch superfamily enzyme|nr:N-acetyltransferase [Bacteroidales bacterium]HBU46087.1 dTDP-6-deoxy-3,4-keto-hexulose isomerase [Porphyromonadaceae bacterium]